MVEDSLPRTTQVLLPAATVQGGELLCQIRHHPSKDATNFQLIVYFRRGKEIYWATQRLILCYRLRIGSDGAVSRRMVSPFAALSWFAFSFFAIIESCLLHLSPEQIAVAEACGVSFLPASDAQVQRLAMQRKVFYRAGAPILATRGDGLFETIGTLQQLIEEGRQQQRDLAQWMEVATPGAAVAPEALPEAALTEPVPLPEPVTAEAVAPPPKRPRQKRRPPELVVSELAVPEMAAEEATIEPTQNVEAEMVESVAAPLLPALSRSLGRTAVRVPAAAAETPGQDRGKRWLMAGAARRGRAGKHWSTRQR